MKQKLFTSFKYKREPPKFLVHYFLLTFSFPDIINVLVILTATMPFLTGERFGKFDHHIMKYCAILYLIQIMAGLTSSDGFSDRDSDESDVQRLGKYSQLFVYLILLHFFLENNFYFFYFQLNGYQNVSDLVIKSDLVLVLCVEVFCTFCAVPLCFTIVLLMYHYQLAALLLELLIALIRKIIRI